MISGIVIEFFAGSVIQVTNRFSYKFVYFSIDALEAIPEKKRTWEIDMELAKYIRAYRKLHNYAI